MRYCTFHRILWEPGRNNDNADLTLLKFLVAHNTEDNLCVLINRFADDFRRFLDFEYSEVFGTSDHEENTACAIDRNIKEWGIHGGGSSVARASGARYTPIRFVALITT